MRLTVAFAAAALLAVGCTNKEKEDLALGGATPGSGWSQWGQDARHQGRVDTSGLPLTRMLADIQVDPHIEEEIAEVSHDDGAERHLLVHFQAPLTAGDDVYTQTKGGKFTPCDPPGSGVPRPCGVDSWSSEIWREEKWSWQDGKLLFQWSYRSDWKPPPDGWPTHGWEPVFHAALAGDKLLVPAARGTLAVIDRASGDFLARIDPFKGDEGSARLRTYVAGPPTVTKSGDVYYHAIRLATIPPYVGAQGQEQTAWDRDIEGAWLVHVAPDGATNVASFADLARDAPGADNLCPGTFRRGELPWPPSPDARPDQVLCGAQRPGLNIAPAVADDGTIYTASRAHFAGTSFMIAVKPDLTTKWVASLAGLLEDGCGTDTLPPTGELGGCAEGAAQGVDPATNAKPRGIVVDSSTASPVVTPDGGVLYGAYTRYNYARGHLFHFAADGGFRGAYSFGWDITPAIYEHDGSYSILLKENHYDAGSYCSDPEICPPREEGPFYITQISPEMQVEWQYKLTNDETCVRHEGGDITCVADHPNGFEWCINAPAVDNRGTVYANGEDGTLYAIPQGGGAAETFFLGEALGAAYTPMALDQRGRVYTQNIGRLFVIGE